MLLPEAQLMRHTGALLLIKLYNLCMHVRVVSKIFLYKLNQNLNRFSSIWFSKDAEMEKVTNIDSPIDNKKQDNFGRTQLRIYHRTELGIQNNWKNRLVDPSPNVCRSAGLISTLHRGQVLSLSNLRNKLNVNFRGQIADRNHLRYCRTWGGWKLEKIA